MFRLHRKKWMVLSIVTLALSLATMFAVNKLVTIYSVFAEDSSVFVRPSGYTAITDSSLYACVVGDFIKQYPNESIPSTGLTNQQLGKMKYFGLNSYTNCYYGYIENWTGLEKMTSLVAFDDKFDGDYSSIDFSHNTNLSQLYLRSHDDLPANLDFSKNTALTTLFISRGDSANINLSKNTALTHLYIADWDISSVTLPEVNNNLVYVYLVTGIPSGTHFDFSIYPNLEYLSVSGLKYFKYVDVSGNHNLKSLDAYGNYIITGVAPSAINDSYVYDFSQLKYLKNGNHESPGFPGSSGLELPLNGYTIGHNESTFSISERNGISYDTNDMLLTVSRDFSRDEIQLNVDSPELNSTPSLGLLKLPKILDFNANGGASYTETSICYLVLDDTSCMVTIPSSKPARSGYYFLGWADSASATSAVYQPGATTELNTNKTLYAIWAPVYTLSFNGEGWSNIPANQTCHPGSTSGSCTVTIPSTVPTRAGCTFLGYVDYEDFLAGGTAIAGSDNGYEVTLHAPGETITLSENKVFLVRFEGTPTEPDNPDDPTPDDPTPDDPTPDDPTPDDPTPDDPTPDDPTPDDPTNPDGSEKPVDGVEEDKDNDIVVPNTAAPDTGDNMGSREWATAVYLLVLPVVVAVAAIGIYVGRAKKWHKKFD